MSKRRVYTMLITSKLFRCQIMSLFPLAQPLKAIPLISTACHLYSKSIIMALPLSAITVLLLETIRYGAALFPTFWQTYALKGGMFLLVFLFPLVGMMFILIDNIAKEQSHSYYHTFMIMLQSFLSYMAGILSTLLLPVLVFGLGLVLFFVLLHNRIAPIWLMLTQCLTFLGVFAAFIPKIFTPIVVVVDRLDANSAVDYSMKLVKHRYFRTFGFVFYALFLIILLTQVSHIVGYFYPHMALNPFILGTEAFLLTVIGPWSLALLLTLKSDLEVRKGLEVNSKVSHQPVLKPQSIPTKQGNADF